MLKQKIQRFATGAMALFMTASSGFSYAVPVYAEEVTTAAARKKKEEQLTEDEDSTLKLNENSNDEEESSLKKEAEDELKIEKILIAQHNGANLYVSKADQERLKTATKGNEDIPDSGKTKEKSVRFYKSGYVDVWITDTADGSSGSSDVVTKARINISRSSAPSWDTGMSKATTWNCSLTIKSSKNYHNLKLTNKDGKVTSKKDENLYDGKKGTYSILNFGLSFKQHAHYKRNTPNHYKRTYEQNARLNFNKYQQMMAGQVSSLDTTLRHSDTDISANFQVNMIQAGLRTDGDNLTRYQGAIGKLSYSKPKHSVNYKNGYGENKTYKHYDVIDGKKPTVPAAPTRDGYNFAGWTGDTTSIVCGSRTITATWTPQQHEVAYNTNGGSYDNYGK